MTTYQLIYTFKLSFINWNCTNDDLTWRITASPGMSNLTFSSIYLKIWQGLVNMEKDPHAEVVNMTKLLTDYIRNKVLHSINIIIIHFIPIKIRDQQSAARGPPPGPRP